MDDFERREKKELPGLHNGIGGMQPSESINVPEPLPPAEDHQWVQRGPYKVCISCPYEHTLSRVELPN
jgi:hypothetical protein